MRWLVIGLSTTFFFSEIAFAKSCVRTIHDFAFFDYPTGLGGRARGAKLAPQAIRDAGFFEALQAKGFKGRGQSVDIEDFSDPLEFIEPSYEGEAGPSSIHYRDLLLKAITSLRDKNLEALRARKIPFNIGGDHSLELAVLASLSHFGAEKEQKINLVRFDAHPDIHTPRSSHSKNLHGMTLAHALRLPDSDGDILNLFHPHSDTLGKISMIGVRDIDKAEWNHLDQLSQTQPGRIHLFNPDRIHREGMKAVMDQVIDSSTQNGEKFHFTFDLDGIDPSFAPGVGTRVPEGLSLQDAHYVAERIFLEWQKGNVTSMDVVELDPARDPSGESTKIMVDIMKRMTLGP